MELSKKMLSVLMSVVLVLGLNPATYAHAAEGDSVEQQGVAQEASKNLSLGEQGSSAPNETEKLANSEKSVKMEKTSSEASINSNEFKMKEDGLTDDMTSVIGFLYMDLKTASPGDTQLFAVALADAAAEVSSMSLEIVDEQGTVYVLDALSCVDNAASFEMAIYEKLPQGIYRISEITYQMLGSAVEHRVAVPVGDSGQYCFTISAKDEVDSSVERIESAAEETTVFAIDDTGSLVEAETVGDAISVAQLSGVSTFSARARATGIVVALDPGHGADPNTGEYDPGASGNGIVEAEVNASIARYCKEELEGYFGVSVLTTPRYKSVNARVDWAIANGAQVYVSLHNNSGFSGARGFEIYVPNESEFNYAAHVTGTELGAKIEAQLANLGLYDRGVKYRDSENVNGDGPYYYDDGHLADYYSAIERSRQSGIAGIIVEHAFVSNAADAAYLASESNLQKLGVADATAIAQQYGLFKASEGQYEGVYDYEYYVSHHPDVSQAFGKDRTAVFRHFLEYGMQEGRQASEVFDPNYYKSTYKDIADKYGSEMTEYYQHFLSTGMREGWQGSETFSVSSYYNQYPDLRRAFGTSSWEPYYLHYLSNGKAEGRAGVGCNSILEAVSSYDGTDYSPVYNGASYASRNVDVAAYASMKVGADTVVDDSKLLAHFVSYGMREGRQGSETFSVSSYYNQYPDLRRAFGTSSWEPYYRHYLDTGKAEGRAGTGCDDMVYDSYSSIMGQTETTVAQMVRRFKANNASYPSSTYSKYGASTVEAFCQILYEEAMTEGVRAEVLFSQVVLETGWLRFGGDVKADQCNFGGIGATGGVPGNSFNDWGLNSVRKGLRAQTQHLKAYASKDSLMNPCVDPRFDYVARGCAPTVEELSKKWASDDRYGKKLLEQMSALFQA